MAFLSLRFAAATLTMQTPKDYLKELDDLGRISVLFKSFPHHESSTDFAAQINPTLENKKSRILSDPQTM